MIKEATPLVLDIQTSEDGKTDNKTSKEDKDVNLVVDPNQKLENGITMREARQLIDELAEIWEDQGVTKDEIQKRLELAAEDWGTTLETIEMVDLTETPILPSTGGNDRNTNNNNNTGNTGDAEPGYTGGNDIISGDYDDLPDWMKEFAVDGEGGYSPDTSDWENPFK